MIFNFKEFCENWQNYLVQSILAAATIFCVLLYLQLQEIAIVASIGASTFIVFAMPKSVPAKPRNLIGGQISCIFIGVFFHQFLPETAIYSALLVSVAVGFAIFCMVVLDFEHPPATATTLGIALNGIDLKIALAFAGSIVFLSLTHKLFGKHLRDLV